MYCGGGLSFSTFCWVARCFLFLRFLAGLVELFVQTSVEARRGVYERRIAIQNACRKPEVDQSRFPKVRFSIARLYIVYYIADYIATQYIASYIASYI